ncbi:hypothetical protein Leef1_21 [Polaribacter phage Leef_1]|uniref:Uncharacterized protein n=1 Tax=Polaribacter phage Leef_1 TaxID=2745684 RepID=A0A8E4ZMR8_9CAUD|nr:hypothetical protein M1M28_gp21 [Polaribacter phage Leef_1]QQV91385.1 hypothetical protein Leef1_21 [Polaribacter phage Leef_1]
MKNVLRIRIKDLFAKAVNSGMSPEAANNLFTESINEVTGNTPKQKKPIALTTGS